MLVFRVGQIDVGLSVSACVGGDSLPGRHGGHSSGMADTIETRGFAGIGLADELAATIAVRATPAPHN
jgi:hypothetical protein